MEASAAAPTPAPSGRDGPVRVLVVDDQELLRDALATMIETDARLELAGTASDGLEAVEAVRSGLVDVVLMDIRMPRLDGIAATEQVLRLRPGVRVLVLTTFDLDEYVLAAVRAGASGFLTKDARPAELTAAIVAVAAGDAAVSPRATRTLLRHVHQQPVAEAEAALAPLSPREREVLRELASGASNEEVGRRLFLTTNTVKTHVKAILAKLGLPDRIHVVIWAYEHGVAGRSADA
ncbi:two component transcriptional regulator, LuxR family [Agrococcus baldri]|uniref:Two component transcriptional regulator, LuxR family n=1 Tax=Agrococcus baldri TaxID=153730 RepID=A0AA94HMV5_9MICO|nr:response regulator transcription factor [Agrococcus baldri]SFS11040.1 two component transcriptional regulator, LuxR family [Agrococcus baldri]